MQTVEEKPRARLTLPSTTDAENDGGAPTFEKAAADRPSKWMRIWSRRQVYIAALAAAGIILHLILRFASHAGTQVVEAPLIVTLALGGIPLVFELALKLVRGQFGSDLLAGISIVTSAILHQYLAGALVVLMVSGGETLESYAVASASSVLRALASRMPSVAHRMQGSTITDIAVDRIAIGDLLAVFPHEICPVDGVVVEGHGEMDESYLTANGRA